MSSSSNEHIGQLVVRAYNILKDEPDNHPKDGFKLSELKRLARQVAHDCGGEYSSVELGAFVHTALLLAEKGMKYKTLAAFQASFDLYISRNRNKPEFGDRQFWYNLEAH